MDWLIAGCVVVALVPLAVFAQRRGWIDLTGADRPHRSGGFPLGPVDEIFAPSRYEAQLEQDRQTALPAPAPIPGDGDNDIFAGGRVKIDLRESLPHREAGNAPAADPPVADPPVAS